MKKRDEVGEIIRNRLDHAFRKLEFYEDDHVYVMDGKILNSTTSSIKKYCEPQKPRISGQLKGKITMIDDFGSDFQEMFGIK